MHLSLTEIESVGINSLYNFADGHAYQELTPSQENIIAKMDSIWHTSKSKNIREAERDYKSAFVNLSTCNSLAKYNHFKICPTASNSIDIAAAWLKSENKITALLEPSFDNIYLLLKRRGVTTVSLKEYDLHHRCLNKLNVKQKSALFLVNPNNPTGKTISKEKFLEIVNYCVINQCILIIDFTFRFFHPAVFDEYEILLSSGVSFITIEDTGKVWPTQDLKASLMFYSQDVASQLEIIYEELYLCVSNFSLEILSAFLQDASIIGLEKTVWHETKKRRELFRSAIEHSCLSICEESVNSKLSLEWVKINNGFQSDYHALNFLKKHNVIPLPGRHFYWSSLSTNPVTGYLRFSLLKPMPAFLIGLNQLNESLSLISRTK